MCIQNLILVNTNLFKYLKISDYELQIYIL